MKIVDHDRLLAWLQTRKSPAAGPPSFGSRARTRKENRGPRDRRLRHWGRERPEPAAAGGKRLLCTSRAFRPFSFTPTRRCHGEALSCKL
jgi:hypothetical protein